MGRPLAILSEGRLSDSQTRTLTLASLGWLELILAPSEVEEIRRRRRIGVIVTPSRNNRKKEQEDEYNERIKKDDEEIIAIIRTFISCQS